MFALAYYGALRREELIGLCVSEFDVAHRLISALPSGRQLPHHLSTASSFRKNPPILSHLSLQSGSTE
jgi:integrase